jgi:inorganic phosphate transporter, PiT family
MITVLIVLAALWLAFSNGANDNFKGVATLYGSDTLSYRKALGLATVTTFAGSVVAIVAAKKLVATFSGAGLVPDDLAKMTTFSLAAGLGAALTIFGATRIGMPTSTTHALIGGLLGGGLAAQAQINGGVLVAKFAMPMLISPLLAIAIAASLYLVLTTLRQRLGVTKETSCICLTESLNPALAIGDGTLAMSNNLLLDRREVAIVVDTAVNCQPQMLETQRYQGRILGIQLQPLLDMLHICSAGAVCFSRALNDTPKIAALLLMTAFLPGPVSLVVIGLLMAIGGVIQSRRIAETMSKRITNLNPGQGLAANLTTAGLVFAASSWGLPVSTTHVSCGAIFGIGAVNRQAQWKTIVSILTTWLTTLPCAALLSGLLYLTLKRLA